MKRLWIIALALVLCFSFVGCGEQAEEDVVLDASADDPELSDTDWANRVWNESIDNMFKAGYAEENEEDGIIFNCAADGEIFLSPDAKANLTSDFKVDGKVIWGWADKTKTEEGIMYLDTASSTMEEEDPEISHYVSRNATAPVKAEVFAKSRGRCKYLIMAVGLCFKIDPDFYFGPVDRKQAVTYVFVIDAPNRQVVHLQYINYNIPGASTTNPSGEIYLDTARGYMNDLCD